MRDEQAGAILLLTFRVESLNPDAVPFKSELVPQKYVFKTIWKIALR